MIRTTIGVTCVAVLALLIPTANASAQSYPAPEYRLPPRCLLAKLTVSQVRVVRRAQALVFRGGISSTASRSVNMTLRGAGAPFRFRIAIRSGRIGKTTVIPPRFASRRSSRLTIEYPGDADTCSQTVQVVASSRAAALRRTSSSYASDTGRLRAAGTVSALARGRVQLQLQFVSANDSVLTGLIDVPIRNGRWSYNKVLPDLLRGEIANRRGILQLGVLYAGSALRRVWGEVRSVGLLGAPS